MNPESPTIQTTFPNSLPSQAPFPSSFSLTRQTYPHCFHTFLNLYSGYERKAPVVDQVGLFSIGTTRPNTTKPEREVDYSFSFFWPFGSSALAPFMVFGKKARLFCARKRGLRGACGGMARMLGMVEQKHERASSKLAALCSRIPLQLLQVHGYS